MPLQRLKAATTPEHERLERSLDLFSTVRTLAEYRAYLRRFYRMMATLEPQLVAKAVEFGFGSYFPARAKLPRLRADLCALEEKELDLKNLPPPPTVPHLSDREAWLGTMYVVEGSSLGAQIICKHYAKTLGLSQERGLSFFYGYGPETGLRWREFCVDLKLGLERSPEAESAITKAAADAFAAFETCLAEARAKS